MSDLFNPFHMAAEIEIHKERIAALEARLEIRPDIPYDGIECRDETIRQYADQICDLKIRISRQVEVIRQACEVLGGIVSRGLTVRDWNRIDMVDKALSAAIKKEMP